MSLVEGVEEHTSAERAREIREKLRNPPNAVPDTGINMRNGHVVKVEQPKPEPEPTPELPLPDDVIDFSLVRLVTKAAESKFDPEKEPRRPTIAEIIRVVAEFYQTTPTDLLAQRRAIPVVFPRQVAMYLCKTMTLCSLPMIGRGMAGRDHSTILHGVRKIEHWLAHDERLQDDIQLLKMRLISLCETGTYDTSKTAPAIRRFQVSEKQVRFMREIEEAGGSVPLESLSPLVKRNDRTRKACTDRGFVWFDRGTWEWTLTDLGRQALAQIS